MTRMITGLIVSFSIAANCPADIHAASRRPWPEGRWLAEDIRGGGVIDYLQTVLEILPDGQITGFGGCNAMKSNAIISGETIRFGPVSSPDKLCTPAVMHQEERFFSTLPDVRFWSVDIMRQKLVLHDEARNAILVMALIVSDPEKENPAP